MTPTDSPTAKDSATPADVAPEETPEEAPEVDPEVDPETAEEIDEPSPPEVSQAEAARRPIPENLPAQVEAALLTLDRAISSAKLAEVLGGIPAKAIDDAIATLNQAYEKTGRSFRIEKVAGGFQVMTLPKYADVLSELHKTRQQNKLSPSQLETLAIVAYKQPIMRSQIEAIRGSASGEVLRALMDRHMVKIVGRAEELGRPMLYGTTKQFLEVFGLSGLKDLPKAGKEH